MKIQSVFFAGLLIVFLCFGIVPAFSATDSTNQKVRIGVLAHRGTETALKMWTPTADYLTKHIPSYSFSIVSLGFHEIGPAVGRGDVDFILSNSSMYADLEARYNVTRIATLKSKGRQGEHSVFGGVIFCRADRNDIHALADLKGRSFLAVDEDSLGGWQVAWRELKQSGLDPFRDFKKGIQFACTTHDDVVLSVQNRKVDAGTVRTDTLERMASEGKIDLQDFRILNQRQEKGFPFLLSTRLYPEWPLAVAEHTGFELAKQVAIALLKMPHNDPAAEAGNVNGWTVPLDYHPVHDLMKELRLGPYKDYGKITPADVIRQYWRWVVLLVAALLIMLALFLHVLRLNRHLARSKQLVEEARSGLEKEVEIRTADLRTANEGLAVAKEEWERTFNSISDPIMILDTNYKIIKANKAMAGALGVSPDKAVGMTCYESVHGTDSPPGFCPHGRLLTDGKARSQEIFEPRLGGHYLISVSPLHAPDGTLIGSIHAARDITELKRAEDIVQKSEKYMRDITASLGEGVYVLNANGETTFMNPEAEALLGWSEKELLHRNIHDLVHNRRADGTPLLFKDCEMRKVIQTGNKFHSTEEVFVRKDGTAFPVSVHSRPLMEDGKVVAAVTAFRDISERKQIEQEREKLIADLQKALAEINTLHGILPICSYCKKIRDDKGAWMQMELYISRRTDAQFSHGICSECARKEFPDYFKEPGGQDQTQSPQKS